MPSPAGRPTRLPLAPVLLLLVALWCAGSVAVWRATEQGLVLGNDSVTYWSSALALADGRGLTTPFENEYQGLPLDDKLAHVGAVPLSLWPPLTTVSLRLADAVLPGGPASAARTLQAALAGVTCAATGLLAWWLASRGRLGLLAGAVAGSALALHPSFVVSHVLLSSEPLFLAVQTTGLVALLAALRRPTTPRIAVAAVLAAGAGLTRIAGIASAAVLGGALACWAPLTPPRRRHLVGLGSGVLAAVPLVVWQLVRSTGSSRGVTWHGRTELLGDLGRTARVTVLPGPPSLPGAVPTSGPTLWAVLVATVLVGTAVLGWWAAHTGGHRRDTRDALVVGGHLLVLLAVLLATAALVDRTFPLDTRTTLPLLPGAAALVAAGAAQFARQLRPAASEVSPTTPVTPVAAGLVALATIAAAVALGLQADRTAERYWSRPIPGLAATPPRDADGEAIAALPDGLVLFSNQPAATWVRSGRGSLALPTLTFPMTGRANPDAEEETRRVADLVAADDAAIVIDEGSRLFTAFLVDPERFATDPRLEVRHASPAVRIVTARQG